MQPFDRPPVSRDHDPQSRLDSRSVGSQPFEHLELDGTFWLEMAGAQLGAWFSGASNSYVSLETEGWITLSGEPWMGFNVACVLDSPRATSLFKRYAARVGDRPGVLIVEQVTREVLELAERMGARHVGEISFMVFDEETAPSGKDLVAVRQITTLADLTPTVVRIAESFSMNLQACLDLLEPTLENPNAAIWVAEKDSQITSAVMSWRTGSIVGLHCLATSKGYRGRGIAHSLVCQLMARQMSDGVRRFFLHAASSGRRFAEGIGYHPVALPHAFLINDHPNTSGFRNQ